MVFRKPRVVVLTSGDELVQPGERPGRGEIRESNTLLLAALSRACGAEVLDGGVVRDEPRLLEAAFRSALGACDLLITTGGVSMGAHDFVGAALAAAGVEPVFHKVAIQPGKPLWYGLWGGGGSRRVPVLALPGNPVSCMVNHAVFVRPALDRLGGVVAAEVTPLRGRWSGAALKANPRERHVPVRRAVPTASGAEVTLMPVPWNGSADVIGLLAADAFAVLPLETPIEPGAVVEYWTLA